jgi:quercetin dioxygenase-like cupin family protein
VAVRTVEASRIDLAPGAGAGLHTHPCPVVGVVLAGAVRYRVEGGPASVLTAGEAFYEPRNARIAEFANASATEPASFAAFYLLAGGEEGLIEMLDA